MSRSRESSSSLPVIAAIAILLVIVLPIFYFLSIGPAIWLAEHEFVAIEWVEVVYYPVSALHEYCPPIQPWLEAYVGLFVS